MFDPLLVLLSHVTKHRPQTQDTFYTSQKGTFKTDIQNKTTLFAALSLDFDRLLGVLGSGRDSHWMSIGSIGDRRPTIRDDAYSRKYLCRSLHGFQ